MTNKRTKVSRSFERYLAQLVIVFVAQLAAGKLGDVVQSLNKGGIGPVWPAAGIAVGALLLCGYSLWPGVAAGAFLLVFLGPLHHWAAAVYATGTTLAALLAVFLLRSVAHFDDSLSRLRDVFALILLGAFGSSVVSASIGASTLYAAHIRGWSGFGPAWLIYWLGDSTGVLVVTPFVVTLPTLFRIREWHRLAEYTVLLLLLTLTCFTVFGDLPLIQVRLHVLAFAVLPFVMWAAIRFGMSTTALSIVLIATIATVETALGSGPFAVNTPVMNAVLLDAFFAIVSVTGLTLAGAICEREQAERERERLVRERAEAESRLRYSAIVESSEDAIASGTLDGTIVSWNAGAERMYGYTEAEVVGKPITILVPPDLPEEENKILGTVSAGGRIEHFETVRVTKTGKRINVSLSISPIKNPSGGIVGISGIARDITERKQAEEALRVSEERLRLARQAARLGTFERDVRTGRVTWAEGLESLYGLPPGSVHGKTTAFFNDLIHPADRERTAHLIQRALKTGQPTEGEWRAIWPDGSVHWIASRWQVLTDQSGEPSRVVGVNMDITKRKQAEDALVELNHTLEAQSALLKSNEELLKIFVKNVPAAVAMLDREMRYLQVSDRWCTDYLLGRAEILGYSHYELFPDMPERWKEVHRRCLQGEILRADEDRWDGQDGPHWARWEVRPWKTAEGTVGGILILAEDITRRKKMEEALSGMTRKLVEAQEQERARIARELHDDVSQRLALLTIELEQLPAEPSMSRNGVRELQKQISNIANDLQSLSHDLHSPKLEYLGIPAGMRSWCREFAERQKLEIDFTHDVRSVLPTEIGICLFRVLQEALHNAAKHSGAKRMEVQLQEEAGEIHLVVGDSGIGFEIEAVEQGKGLGLTSMRERIRLMNGTIAIESKPMAGTTIRVRIPFHSETVLQCAAG